MSGLLGLVDLSGSPVEPELLEALAAACAYRAPGGITCRVLEGAGLAYFALHQGDRPLFTSGISVLFDGRLDNRPELLARLARDPESPDAALILAAYLEWGDGCLERLLGDFALALWDAPRRRLLCAVDPLGIKPLHWALAGSGLCFASDAAMVLRHPGVPDGYDEGQIAAYLAGRCEDTERSFFAAVHRLAPGHRLIAEAGTVRVERYWSPNPSEIRYARDEDYADHFREIFERAVTDRLRDAGSSACIAMSGGLDSCSVAAVSHRSGAGAHAYTFVFDRLPGCDERSYSRSMTEELGLSVEPVAAESLWALESQAPLPHSPDTPFVGWRTCYAEILRRMRERGSTVLLLGHGGDDLLRGSALVYSERLRRGDLSAVREVASHARRQGEPVSRALYRQFLRPHLPVGADRLLRSVLGHGRRDLAAGPACRTAKQEIGTHLVEIPWYWRLANWHDRNAAGFGIEVRHPFLDRRLFEYVLAIPGEQLFRLSSTKDLLRRSMRGILPESIRLRRGKTVFSPFLDLVLRERAAAEVRELLRAPRAHELGFVDGKRLSSFYFEGLDGGSNESRRALWHAITLEIWLRRCEVIRRDRRRVGQMQQAAA